MKIERIEINGYQGINFLNLDIEQKVVLIGGKNGTGKSSIRDAMRLAMTGESGRVKLKKNYDQLVRIGSDPKQSQVGVVADGFTFSRKVATGKAAHEEVDYPIVLPHLFGFSRFAMLEHKEQAKVMFAATGVKRDKDTVKAMLLERGIAPECVEEAMPMVRAGFAAAEKSCKAKQSEKRGAWEAITEERFGEAKAVNWKADMNTIAPTPMADLVESKESLVRSAKATEGEIEALEEEQSSMRQHTHGSGTQYECPECHAKLTVVTGKLELDERDSPELPPLEEMQAVVEKLNARRRELAETQQQIGHCNAQIAAAQDAERMADERTKKAAGYFESYKQWKAAAEALAPTGIPLQLLEAGLKPINDRLDLTCRLTNWKPIVLASDLSVTYGGIPYNLCSESEQWRVDSAIAEALALLSNVKMFVLDRMDVLHPEDRPATLMWLLEVSKQHDTILCMATLKDQPKGLPEGIQSVWLEENGQLRQAA